MNEYQNRRKNIAVQRYFLRILAGMCLTGMVLVLGGCQIVEPEKRAYPLVIGLDKRSEEYQVSLGMAQLAVSTGQEKEGGEEQNNDSQQMILLMGSSQEEIMDEYNRTRELYLDPGHVQVIVFGKKLLKDSESMEKILAGMEKENSLGNSAFVFQANDPEQIVEMNGTEIESLGQYLTGIYENRPEKQQPVLLSDVYMMYHRKESLEIIPELIPKPEGILEMIEGS